MIDVPQEVFYNKNEPVSNLDQVVRMVEFIYRKDCMKFYVYVYRDPSRNNEPIYVGKGQGRRAYVHIDDAQNNHFKNRLAKMKREGVDPIINVVDMPSEALAVQCEIDTIARFGRKDLGKGSLLNLTDGGDGVSGYIHTAEALQRLSDLSKGREPHNKGKLTSLETRKKQSEAKKGENHPMYGKSPSEASKQKNSAAQKGKVHPKIICPHCGKEGGGGSMKRWHFDNCKQKRDPKIPFD